MKASSKINQTCPVTAVAGLLSDPWTILVIHNLLKVKTQDKTMRFCELERALVGISTRTLTLKLKILEEKNMILKKETGYRLTKKGLKLESVIKEMERFGKSLTIG